MIINKLAVRLSEGFIEKLKEINRNVSVEKTSSGLIILAFFYLLSVFAYYYKTKLEIVNPLIPKYLAYELFEPFAFKGTILTIGLLLASTLKFLKQNLIAILVCVIIVALYHLTPR